jgi:ribosomal protein L37AE/L43A
MNLKQFVDKLDLQEGQTHRGNCPVCGRHNTFTATNDMGSLVWNCYAHSCKVSGGTRVNLSAETIQRLLRKESIEDTNEPFHFPPYVVVNYHSKAIGDLCDKYQLNASSLDLRLDVKEERVVFPIYHGGLIVDAVGRASVNSPPPKWKRYGKARTAYVVGNSSVAVVVEDAISAAVVATLGGTGFALLGTQLLSEHVAMLRQYEYVIVALDPDALTQTIAYKNMLFSEGIDSFAMNLYDDIKYRQEEDIATLTKLIGKHGTLTA